MTDEGSDHTQAHREVEECPECFFSVPSLPERNHPISVYVCVCVRVAAANMTQVFCFTSSSSKKTNKIFFSLPCQPVGYTSRLPISYFLIPLLCLQLSSSQLLRLRIRRLDNLVLKQIAPAFGLNAASVSLPLAQAVRWSSNVWLASRQKHMS